MTALRVLLLLVAQTSVGLGLLNLCDLKLRPVQNWALSVLLGLPASSFAVFFLNVLGIRLTWGSIVAATILPAVALAVPFYRAPKRLRELLQMDPPVIEPCEVVFILFLAFCLLLSLWRCYYIPVTSRDSIVGADLVAKYAVAQGWIRSSVFTDGTLQGQLSNQPFYAPFTALMQVSYRLAGLAFGKLWLSALFLAFLLFLHDALRQRLHPALAGLLAVLFVASPEMYGYTYALTEDFHNAVFFGMSAYFFNEFAAGRGRRSLLASTIFLGFACWSRSETILFVPFVAALAGVVRPGGARARVGAAIRLLIPPVLIFALWHVFFFRFFLHQSPDNQVLYRVYSWSRVLGIAGQLAGLLGSSYHYGYLFVIFGAALLANALFFRAKGGRVYLVWMGILLIGFELMTLHFPAVSIENTIKRGFFKLTPVAVLCLAEMRALEFVSQSLRRWESRLPGLPLRAKRG